jgi:hypothetical protein
MGAGSGNIYQADARFLGDPVLLPTTPFVSQRRATQRISVHAQVTPQETHGKTTDKGHAWIECWGQRLPMGWRR